MKNIFSKIILITFVSVSLGTAAAPRINGFENRFDEMDSSQRDIAIQILSGKHFKKPNNVDLIRDLASLYTAKNNTDSALAYWQLLSVAQPVNDTAFYVEAQLYYYKNDLNEVIAALQKALTISPDNISYLSLLALTDYRAQKEDEALNICNKILEHSATDVNALLLSGIVLRDEKKDMEALERFDRCLKADPANTEALMRRADEYVLLKRYNDALRDYSAARADLIANADILNNIGICYYQAGSYRQAITLFKKAIAINHLQPQSYFNKGLSYYRLDSLDAASVDIKTASAIWDTCYTDTCHAYFLDAIYYLGMCYKKIGDLPAARSHFALLQTEKYPRDMSIEMTYIDRALFISRNWYYLLACLILSILLVAAIVKSIRN